MSGAEFQSIVSQSLEVTPLNQDDLPQVLDIERQCHSFPWSEAVFEDCFKDTYRLYALRHAEALIGYAIVSYLVDEAHLLNICVHPHARRTGAGRHLLRHTMAQAVHDGMQCVILEVRASNEPAAALYLSEGFKEIGLRRGYYPNGSADREDARVMALRFT
ncbi:MAG: ribosomal protein S18-alanine N-acetyltransferase [Pseudomonadota bacterium]|nr:ribosomal protein S18-alanine N-acetyltransferase [Pseudomonadota bacterium]